MNIFTVSSGDHTMNKDDQTEELVLKIVELEETIEKLQAKAGFTDSFDEEKTKFIQQIAEKDKIINEFTCALNFLCCLGPRR